MTASEHSSAELIRSAITQAGNRRVQLQELSIQNGRLRIRLSKGPDIQALVRLVHQAEQLGLLQEPGAVVSQEELSAMTDEELMEQIRLLTE